MKSKRININKSQIVTIVIAIIIISIFTVLINDSKKSTSIVLEGIEIQEYQGEDLSSINDFRENSIKGPQYVDINEYRLKITGLVEEEKLYLYDEVIDRPTYSKIITLDCVEGWSATILWEGIILRELLAEAKPIEEATTIIFHAEDGYTTSYPIEYIMDQDILMAYRMNNMTMVPQRGYPFQLVAEDKWGYKWIKWITEIEFSDDEDYEGFWESRGYSNTANLDEGFY